MHTLSRSRFSIQYKRFVRSHTGSLQSFCVHSVLVVFPKSFREFFRSFIFFIYCTAS